jgi:hypothetical protein
MQWVALAALVQTSFFITSAFAAFGLTESGNTYTVDTNAGLVFKGVFAPSVEPDGRVLILLLAVDKTNGDITSMVYNGIEVRLLIHAFHHKVLKQLYVRLKIREANTLRSLLELAQTAAGSGLATTTTISKLAAQLVESRSKFYSPQREAASHTFHSFYVAKYNDPSIHMAT